MLYRIMSGIIGGVVATGPMTAVMIALHRRLPLKEKYPLPPRKITERISKKAGVNKKMDEEDFSTATLLAHFGYGAAMGGVFAGGLQKLMCDPFSKGILFGALVWIGSYFGLLPILQILRPASEHPMRRNVLMIVAHFIWGVALSLFVNTLAPNETGKRLSKNATGF